MEYGNNELQDSVTTAIVKQDSETLGLSENSNIFNCNDNLKGRVEKKLERFPTTKIYIDISWKIQTEFNLLLE